MRCPKCAYISFDHLDACGNCGRDLSELRKQLNGTATSVVPPLFLVSSTEALVEQQEGFAGDEVSMELSDVEVDFRLEPESAPEQGGEAAAEVVAELAEEDQGAGEVEAEVAELAEEAQPDIDLSAEPVEADIDLAAAEEEEPVTADIDLGVTAAEPVLEAAADADPGQEPEETADLDTLLGDAATEGDDEVVLDFGAIDDSTMEEGTTGSGDDDESVDLDFADGGGYEDLFADLDLFDDSDDGDTDLGEFTVGPQPAAAEEEGAVEVGEVEPVQEAAEEEDPELTLTLDSTEEEAEEAGAAGEEPAVSESGLSLEKDE